MSVRVKKDGGGYDAPTTPENRRCGVGFDALRSQDISSATGDSENADSSSRPNALEASPLQAWIHEYDNEKGATGRGTPSVASAFARVTYTPAATPTPSPEASMKSRLLNLLRSGVEEGYTPKQPQESPTPSPYKQARHRPPLSRNETPPASNLFSKKSSPDSGPRYTASSDELSPSNSRGSSGTSATPHNAPLAKTVEPGSSSQKATPAVKMLQVVWNSDSPVNTWDSASLTRYWTQDQVRLALLRIMSELNLDFYEDHYRLLDFDGNQETVQKLWGEIGVVYTEFLRSHVYGVDILTLIAMNELALNSGPLANINAVLADMICFFAAGKIGMERRAEDMAQALISGGKRSNDMRVCKKLIPGLQVILSLL